MNLSILYYLYNFVMTHAYLQRPVIFLATDFATLVLIIVAMFIVFHIIPSISCMQGRPLRTDFLNQVKNKISTNRGFLSTIIFSPIISWAVVVIIKVFTQVPRPYDSLADVIPLFIYDGFGSFPSGHAAVFCSIAVALVLYYRKIGALCLFAAFLIGLARIASGIHFPVDILSGFILGTLITLFVHYYAKNNNKIVPNTL